MDWAAETVVKVCGLTCFDDAQGALDAGADLVGFVLVKGSTREVSRDQLRSIVSQLERPECSVAVLGNIERNDAVSVVDDTSVAAIQLCGVASAQDFRDFPVPILRRVDVSDAGAREMDQWADVAHCFVLDRPGALGGTGETVDFRKAREMVSRGPCLLAGGLGPENVAAAIEVVAPWGVDASSGLEAAPREKSGRRVLEYIRNARSALTQVER